MALITKAIKGTKDVLPKDVHKNQYIEATALDIASKFGYKEIRTPVFEHTELFQRGVGDTTDVVQKEMYTFDDKGGRSITLRPEGTSGAVRSYLENGLCNEALPQKVCYLTSCYRYEKPQAGRLRELHQFGVEMFGTAEPAADAKFTVQITPPTSPARSRSPQMGERGESESTKAAYSSLLMRIVLISCAQYDRTRENYALCKKQRARRFSGAFVRQLTERIGADALRFFMLL